MRKLLTVVLAMALGALGVAALVDALTVDGGPTARTRGGSAGSGDQLVQRPERKQLPPCRRGQLALALEMLGSGNAVALRHVNGASCHRSPLTLRIAVTNRHGERSEVPLREERVLAGDFSPGFERVVAFSICASGAPFTAEATAGPYVVRGQAQPGGQNCESAQREATVAFGPEPGVKRFVVEALDPSTHSVSFLIDLPHRANVRVTVRTRSGPLLDVLDTERRSDCRRIRNRDSCHIHYGLLGEGAGDEWTVIVRKRSPGTALISFAISFVAARG